MPVASQGGPADLGSALYGAAGRTTLYGPPEGEPQVGTGTTDTGAGSEGSTETGGTNGNDGEGGGGASGGSTNSTQTQSCTDPSGICEGYDEDHAATYIYGIDGIRKYYFEHPGGSRAYYIYDEDDNMVFL